MEYNIKFDRNYIVCNKFERIIANVIKEGICQSRMLEYVSFDSYGILTFLDKQHKEAKVETNDFFDNNTNCLVFNIRDFKFPNGNTYDKLFIYHSNGKVIGNYGIIFWDTKTGNTFQKHFIEDEPTAVFTSLSTIFYV